MKHRELAALAVVGVTAKQATSPGGPGVGDGHTATAQEMPDLGDREDRVVESVVVAVNEEIDLFLRRLCQSRGELFVCAIPVFL